jgi:hypothetical protein
VSPVFAQEYPSRLKLKVKKAQGLTRDSRSENAIKQLQNNGTLVVRLPSKAKKLAAIDAEIIQFANDVRYVKRLRKMRKKTIEDLQYFNSRISTALGAYYSFSDLYFVYDTSIVQLINGKKNNLFMDASLTANPNFTVENKFFLILRCEKLKSGTASNADAFVVADSKNERLDFPFPAVISFNTAFMQSKKSKIYLSDAKQKTFWENGTTKPSDSISSFAGNIPSKKKIKRAVDDLNNSFAKYALRVENLAN